MLLLQNLVDFKRCKFEIFQSYQYTNLLGSSYFYLFDPTFHLVYLGGVHNLRLQFFTHF